MNKTTMRGLATAAVTTMLTVTGVTAATAADCTPSEGTPATFGHWTKIDYTPWTKASSMPADPDGQSGDENPLNKVRIVAQETRPSETAVPEDSDWVRTAPEGAGWVLVDNKVVIDTKALDERVLVTPAVPAVESVWANFSPNKDTGPFDGPPTYPTDSRGTWQVHDQIPGGHADEPDGVYQQGNGTAHGSWFYKLVGSAEVPAVYKTVHHDAVTHNEYRYERTSPGVTEYRWVIEKPDHQRGHRGGAVRDRAAGRRDPGWRDAGHRRAAEDSAEGRRTRRVIPRLPL